jgi:glycosyltransferase involved in cell wall biosynthesis
VPSPRHFGGSERQQVLLAKGLVDRGAEVSFVTLDHGQPSDTIHDRIRVHASYDADAGLPGIRFLWPRWSGLVAGLRRANADIYYQMGADSETGQVGAWCRRQSRCFVFAIASDADCDVRLPLLTRQRQKFLYRHGLMRADRVVAQTSAQQASMRQAFGVGSTVIRNCTPDPGFDPRDVTTLRTGRPRMLWVGRLVPVKRLEVLLDVASARPSLAFDVVASGQDSTYARKVTERAAQMPNVTLRRGVTDLELHDLYRRANVLLCTSSHEGVPTTFLEAWARGVPVVSTVDPDGIIAARELGDVATRPDDLPAVLDRLLARADQVTLAARIREHYLATHTVAAFVTAHEQVFRSLGGDRPGTRHAKEVQ